MVAEGTLVGGRYRILTQVGIGGMSTVYLAMDASLNRRWAVKQMRDAGSAERRDVMLRSLTVESEMIARLDHPAIPRIVDLIDDDTGVFVVMDFVEGQTLRTLLEREGPQDEALVVDWGIQLCDVLDYLHRRTPMVVFRDMKPSNVMLTPDGMVKLIDFGIAIEQGETGENRDGIGDGRRLGTPGYGAPEQFEPGGVLDARVDIHALGATLFQLLTGVHPREGIVPVRRIRPELSTGLEHVIAKATSPDPQQRYASCAEFAYALGHCRDGERSRRRTLLRRWRIFAGTAAASVACLALSAGSLLAADHERNSDYTHWMRQAEQASADPVAEQACRRAAEILPGSIEPYRHLIDRYTADGVFSQAEEATYTALLNRHADALRSDRTAWAQLCFDTGRLYWYYYAVEPNDADAEGSRMTRIRAAAPWMRDAAETETFEETALAGIYAGIAEFNVRIVPLINEGHDGGRYQPYFGLLQRLVESASAQRSEVIRLEAANLALDALLTYPRKFRADGVPRKDMERLCARAGDVVETTDTTADAHDDARDRALGSVPVVLQAIENAYMDHKGDLQ